MRLSQVYRVYIASSLYILYAIFRTRAFETSSSQLSEIAVCNVSWILWQKSFFFSSWKKNLLEFLTRISSYKVILLFCSLYNFWIHKHSLMSANRIVYCQLPSRMVVIFWCIGGTMYSTRIWQTIRNSPPPAVLRDDWFMVRLCMLSARWHLGVYKRTKKWPSWPKIL